VASFLILPELVDFFFVDTTPFQLEYWTHPGNHHYDWRGVAPRGKYIANLLKVRTRNTFRSVREKATYESKLVF
jgi:hypothetical protein